MGPRRPPTVHCGPYAGRPWVAHRHRVYLHNTVAEHDTTHWCQNGRPTQELAGNQPEDWAGDVPRTVTSETLVTCGEHVDTTGDLWRSRPNGRTQVIYEADSEQDEARGGGQHRRFSSQRSRDELLQIIEKPDQERTITTARA